MSKESVETGGTEFQSQAKLELQPGNIIRIVSPKYSIRHPIGSSRDCLLVQITKGDRISRECRKARARVLIAATFTAGEPISKFAQELLQEYGIEDKDIDRWYKLLFVKHMGVQFSVEEEQDYWRISPLVDQCLSCRCSDSSNQPDDDDEPNFERTIGDLIADARAKKHAKAEPALAAPQLELAPAPPALPPKAEEKRKPKPRKPVRNDGWGRD